MNKNKLENLLIFTENYYRGGVDTFIKNIYLIADQEKKIIINQNHSGYQDFKENYKVYGYKLLNKLITDSLTKKFPSKGIFQKLRIIFQLVTEYTIGLVEYLILSLKLSVNLSKNRGKNFTLMIVSGGYPASLICRIFPLIFKLINPKSKIIFTIHSCAQKSIIIFYLLDRFIDFLLIRIAYKFIFVSKASKRSFIDNRQLKASDKLIHIYNWIKDPLENNQNLFLPLKYQSFFRNRNFPFKIISLSVYSIYKGHLVVFKAIRELLKRGINVSFELYGYGSDSELEFLTTKIKEFNLEDNVSVKNFINPIKILMSSDLLILASLKYEAFGIALIDSMALGIPVFGSNIGGIKEVLSFSKESLFEPGNHNELADKIEYIILNPEISYKRGIKGRKKFINDFNGVKSIDLYKKELNNKT